MHRLSHPAIVAGKCGLAIDHHVPAIEEGTTLAPVSVELLAYNIVKVRGTQESPQGEPRRGQDVINIPSMRTE